MSRNPNPTNAFTLQYAHGNFTTSGSANQIVSPQAHGTSIRVMSVFLMGSSAVNVKMQSTGSAGTITDVSAQFYIPASGGFVLPFSEGGWFQTNPNEGLNLSMDSTSTVGVQITWLPVIP